MAVELVKVRLIESRCGSVRPAGCTGLCQTAPGATRRRERPERMLCVPLPRPVPTRNAGNTQRPTIDARMIPRDVNEDARDVARTLAGTDAFEQSRRDRKRVEMLFAHLKRIFRLSRLRLRGPRGAQDEFTLAAIAQNLCRLVNLVARPPPLAAVCVVA